MNTIRTIFSYLPYAAFLVAYFGFVRRAGFGKVAQVVWTIALLACLSKFICFDLIGGHIFYPEFPEKLVWLWNAAYSGAIILAVLSVLTFLWNGRAKRFLLPLVAWSLALCGLWNGVCAPAVRNVTLEFDNLPANLDGYRIAHVSDIHASCAARTWRTRRIVETVNAFDADAVCLTGDYADGDSSFAHPFIEPLSKLHAKDGVYAVTGNHEYYFDSEQWKPYFRRLGLHFLRGSCVFPRPGLAIGGVNVIRFYGHEKSMQYDINRDVPRAFASATNGEFRILLQHQPRGARGNVDKSHVDLQLSGHTHGGIMPVFATVVGRFNGGFTRGVYELGRSKLVVSTGAGQWAGFPLRFFTPSEILLITLHRSAHCGSANH